MDNAFHRGDFQVFPLTRFRVFTVSARPPAGGSGVSDAVGFMQEATSFITVVDGTHEGLQVLL